MDWRSEKPILAAIAGELKDPGSPEGLGFGARSSSKLSSSFGDRPSSLHQKKEPHQVKVPTFRSVGEYRCAIGIGLKCRINGKVERGRNGMVLS